jgi:hypothetical protein
MSDCLHCDMHEMLDVHLQNEQAEPVTKKRKLWQAAAVMFFVSCLLTVSGMLEYCYDGHPSIFASLEIFFGVCGVIVTLVAWLLTAFV